jgi:hypothetical protein
MVYWGENSLQKLAGLDTIYAAINKK